MGKQATVNSQGQPAQRLLACLPQASNADLQCFVDTVGADNSWRPLVIEWLNMRSLAPDALHSQRQSTIDRLNISAQKPGIPRKLRLSILAEVGLVAYQNRNLPICQQLLALMQAETKPYDDHRFQMLGPRLAIHMSLHQRQWRQVEQALDKAELILADCPDRDLVLEFRCHRLRYLMDRRHLLACKDLLAELEPETQRLQQRIGWSYHEAYARFSLESGDMRTMQWLLSEACPIAITSDLAVPYYLALGQIETARAHLHPTEPSPYLQGLIGLADKNTAEVRQALGNLHASPDSLESATPQLLQLAALAGLAEGRPQHARLCLGQLDPEEDYGDCHVEWARVHLAQDNWPRACWHLNAAIAASGQSSIFLRLGFATEISAADLARLWLEALSREPEPRSSAAKDLTAHSDPLLSGPPTQWSNEDRGEAILIGDSPEMQRVRRRIHLFADREETVLILAETGCGKEIAARMLHDLGPRRESAFIAVNCAALSEHLAEAELFGHAAGAFTGGEQARKGIFATAETGTLFLDEVAALPTRLQGLLLRVLETGDYLPVGSSNPRQCQARIIAAANESLELAVEEGRFRRDLYFRLRRLSVEIAPLRERLDDLDSLTAHFIRRRGLEGRHHVDNSLLTVWRDYDWPGNVRELRNEVDNLIILHGAESAWTARHSTLSAATHKTPAPLPVTSTKVYAASSERQHIPGIGRALERRQQILDLARQEGRLTQKHTITALGCAANTARTDLAALCKAGLLRRVRTSANLATGWFELTAQ